MDLAEYTTMAKMEDAYWWHLGKKQIVRNQLAKFYAQTPTVEILNIGCGTGGTVPTISQFGRVTNVDTSPEAIRYCQQANIDNLVQVEGLDLPFPDQSFEAALALDVLEHIEDDRQALTEWFRLLKPGGKLILTVPAYQWLWSGHDVSLQHYRRYHRQPLIQLMESVGFKVIKGSHAVSFSLPLIVGYRLAQRVVKSKRQTSYVPLPQPINSLFAGMLSVEARLLRTINIPFGTSILMVVERP